MGFKHGRLAEVTVNTKALSAFCDTADIAIKVDTAETSVFQPLAVTAPYKTYLPGLAGATLQLAGSYDPTVTTGPASVLTLLIGAAPFAVLYYPAGNNAGQGTSHSFNAILTDYQESSAIGAAVKFSATLLVTGVDTITQL